MNGVGGGGKSRVDDRRPMPTGEESGGNFNLPSETVGSKA